MKIEPMLTPEDVAELLQVNVETVRRMIHRKLIPFSRIGRLYRITSEDMRAFVAGCRIATQKPVKL